ncbi:MAG: hypothetical protein ACI4XP_03570 [Acutalibacteraceae bacterium]
MSDFNSKGVTNDLEVLLGVKHCVRDIVDCYADKSDLKYDEKCYSVALNQNSVTQSVNAMCFIDNPQAPKKRITQ